MVVVLNNYAKIQLIFHTNCVIRTYNYALSPYCYSIGRIKLVGMSASQ